MDKSLSEQVSTNKKKVVFSSPSPETSIIFHITYTLVYLFCSVFTQISSPHSPESCPSPLQALSVAGLGAGLTEAVVVNPFEVVKVSLQANRDAFTEVDGNKLQTYDVW